MPRNRLILACAAVLLLGMWIAWRSVSSVEPRVDTRLPVLVAGIVVDDHDTPVEVASLSVGHHEEDSFSTPGGTRISRSDVSGRFEISRSDASGRFEVRGFEESLHPYVI